MNSHTWVHAPLATAVVSLRSSGALVLLGVELYDTAGEACLEITQRSGSIKHICPTSVGVWIGS